MSCALKKVINNCLGCPASDGGALLYSSFFEKKFQFRGKFFFFHNYLCFKWL